jgi:hypothetical protein
LISSSYLFQGERWLVLPSTFLLGTNLELFVFMFLLVTRPEIVDFILLLVVRLRVFAPSFYLLQGICFHASTCSRLQSCRNRRYKVLSPQISGDAQTRAHRLAKAQEERRKDLETLIRDMKCVFPTCLAELLINKLTPMFSISVV